LGELITVWRNKLKRLIKDYAFLLSISGAVVLLDQVSKNIVRSNLHFGEIWPQNHWIVNYARIVHWSNTGAAFGMLQNFGAVFAVLAVVVSIAILIYFPKVPRDDWILRLALSLQLGGAVGNLIDRLTIGHVTDFISLDNFAVFNVADASISIGTVLLAVSLIQRERKEKSEKSQLEEDEDPNSNELAPSPPFEELKGE
jgi:signal peptidase II